MESVHELVSIRIWMSECSEQVRFLIVKPTSAYQQTLSTIYYVYYNYTYWDSSNKVMKDLNKQPLCKQCNIQEQAECEIKLVKFNQSQALQFWLFSIFLLFPLSEMVEEVVSVFTELKNLLPLITALKKNSLGSCLCLQWQPHDCTCSYLCLRCAAHNAWRISLLG